MSEPLIHRINREQLCFRAIDVERLIGDEHPARAIWEAVGHWDLSRFYEQIESKEGEGGRPAYDPRLLISMWIYAYREGWGSAREVARLCEWEPGLQWLTGCEVVNYHTLASFRMEHKEELDELFTQVLGMLAAEKLIELEQVMQDGTKIKAQASGKSFRQEEGLREHLERARRHVQSMGDPRAEPSAPRSQQKEKARERAQREREQRLRHGLEELEKLRAHKAGDKDRQNARVSMSDPEARIMKQSDGGFAPSYNVQISTDAAHGLIVGVQVVQDGNDSAQLQPALQRMQERLQRQPRQMVADGDYTNRKNIEAMEAAGVDYIGSLGKRKTNQALPVNDRLPTAQFIYDPRQNHYVCPQGKPLSYRGQAKNKSGMYSRYAARWKDCQGCPRKEQCCPHNHSHGRGILRGQENLTLNAFALKMETPEARSQYRRRAPVAEFCHAWIKQKLNLRQFHVRGLLKVQTEMLWACITYNLQRWIRIKKQQSALAVA